MPEHRRPRHRHRHRPAVPAATGAHAGFRPDVEGMRAVAVLAVVLFHAGVGAVGGGFAGVDVFFVLSGYLITGLLWAELARTGTIGLAEFYARRIRRLLPAAALVLVATAVASATLLPPLRARPALGDVLSAGLYAANYRFALQRTDYLNADAPPSPVQHYWSLGVEEQFYLLWPVLLAVAALGLRRGARASRVRAAVALGGVGAGSLALSLHLTRVSQPWAFFSLPTRAWELAAGGVVALAVPALRRLPAAAAAPLGWLGLATVLAAVVRLGESTPYPGTAAILPVAGTAAVLAAGVRPVRGGPALLLGRAPLRFAGRLSYSWYLWHWPLLVLAPAALGRPLTTAEGLVLTGAGGLLAYGTVRLVEDPARFSPRLRARPARGLALGAALTAVVAVGCVGAVAMVPVPRGWGAPAAVAALPPISRAAAPARSASAAERRLAAVSAPVFAAVRAAAATRAVPANLSPPIATAHGDKAAPFTDGCHLSWTATTSPGCTYGDPRSRTSVVLFGDSHATQWFPALERIATTRHWRLVVLTKSTCPPVQISIVSPVLGRAYTECDRWRAHALARIRAERPVAVVLGVARHYGEVYHFTVYGRPWLTGLAAMVRAVRAAGAAAVVLGPTPKPAADVPDCLSEHLSDATACATPAGQAVNAAGMRAEQVATTRAGGTYVPVSRWICTPAACPPVVGRLLVYRDDNHLSTGYPAWLAPVLAVQLDAAIAARHR
ncbi:MAG TPA: acyltransferase family protein [Mycobacteriales bacterium]